MNGQEEDKDVLVPWIGILDVRVGDGMFNHDVLIFS